jgi:hypothetical protein
MRWLWRHLDQEGGSMSLDLFTDYAGSVVFVVLLLFLMGA